MKIKHIIITFLLSSLFANLWAYFEEAIYGAAEFRVVDDIMILLMMPFFYITSVWLDERQNKQEIPMNQNIRNDENLEGN